MGVRTLIGVRSLVRGICRCLSEKLTNLFQKKYQPEGWNFHFWWAHQDLNLGPKDSGLCDFHHSLDYAFTV